MGSSGRARVLLVEDESLNIQLLGNALTDECDLLLAKDGETALDIVHSEDIDLILLDVGLPGMDGYQVCEALKKDPDTRNIPVIFVTANDSAADELRGLELGAVDYFTKPYKVPLVRVRVRLQLELKKKTDLLEQWASLDGLTHIPNRRQFELIFDNEWRRAMRKGYRLSLVFIDIDHFKALNDKQGHLQGDLCLQQVARELERRCKRAGDFVARYGGEEFIVIVPENELDGAIVFADKLRQSIEDKAISHPDSSCSKVLTVSVGVASCCPNKNMHKTQLLQAADEQLYLAKNAGRNQVKGAQI